MTIIPSAEIRQNYNKISEECKKKKEPIFITKNGEGDLVIMDIDTFEKRERLLRLREELIEVEEAKIHGNAGMFLEDADKLLTAAIKTEAL